MPLAPGTLLHDRYRINSILGQGGMGAVYRATDENLQVSVAVKENLFLTEEYSLQFQREARILAGLRHSNLPHVLDYFSMEFQGQYLVMDYIEGEDLRQRMERIGTLPEREAILVGVSICDALSYLHTREPAVVHRDIKPGNIKVTPDGQAVLVDFGLAKVMQGSQATSTGARAMTPGYSPPEQYGTARTDPRSDIYSLGATLYAALTGAIPQDSLARMTLKEELTPLRDLLPRANRRLAEVIEKALEINPEDRFQTAVEFRKGLLEAGELSPVFLDRPTLAPPPGTELTPEQVAEGHSTGRKPFSRIRKWLTRNYFLRSRRSTRRIAWALIPIFALVIACVGIPLLYRREVTQSLATIFNVLAADALSTPSPATAISASSFTISPTPPVSNTPIILSATPTSLGQPVVEQVTPTPTVILSPSPTALGGGTSQIAFASDRSGIVQIWLMNSDGSQQKQLTNVSGGACQPAWSPDGTRLIFTSPCPGERTSYPGSGLYLFNLTDSKITLLPASPEGDYDPAWSPDGMRVAFTSLRNGDSSIFVMDLNTNTVTDLSRGKFNDNQPSWSPGGMQLAFVRKYINTQVWIMSDMGQFQAQFSKSEGVVNMFPAWSADGSIVYYTQTSVDAYVPWLAGLRYEDRNKLREFKIPTKADSSVGPVAQARPSQDGLWLAYESWPDGSNHDIYRMKANGTGALRLTTDPGVDFGPAWRPSATGGTLLATPTSPQP